jgi:polyribonucleotide nucleotidyltransferase
MGSGLLPSYEKFHQRKFAKKICHNGVRKIGRFVISAKQLLWEGKIITHRHTNGILSRQETWGLQEHNLSTKTNSRLPF